MNTHCRVFAKGLSKRSNFVLAVLLICFYSAHAQSPDEPFKECTKKVQGQMRLQVSPGVMGGLFIKIVRPDANDLRTVKNSTVKIKVLIDQTGTVRCAVGIEGDSALYERSANAALGWKFQPYVLNGEPVIVESAVYFHYNKRKVVADFQPGNS